MMKSFESKVYILLFIIGIILFSLLSVLPVLVDPRFCILDCSVFYNIAEQVNLLDPTIYITDPQFSNRAGYGHLLYLFPIYWSVNPAIRVWFYSGVMLSCTMACIFWILYKISDNEWFALFGIVPCLANAAFTENYFTLFKGEPYIFAGTAIIGLLLWQLLYEKPLIYSYIRRLNLFSTALLAALFVYSMKETGVAFIVVYFVGLVVLGWGSGLSAKEIVRKTWVVTIPNIICFAIFLARFLRLKSHYSVSGRTEYSFTIAGLSAGAVRLSKYFIDTSAYVLPAFIIVVIAFHIYVAQVLDDSSQRKLRIKIAWTSFFAVLFAGMAGILVPWQELIVRYLLVGSAGAIIMSLLAVDLGIFMVRHRLNAWVKLVIIDVVGITSFMLVAHTVYALLLGPLSEGNARHKFDKTYDEMFRYVAAQTRSNGTAYFMMDSDFTEPIENTRIGMRVLYDRPDIYCAFPQSPSAFTQKGLVAVTVLKDFSFNYPRMPVHADASAGFSKLKSNDLSFVLVTSFVYRTPVLYVRDEYNVPQYKAWWGIPAFWELKRGVYHFGWSIYRFAGNEAGREDAAVLASGSEDLVRDGSFAQGWLCWDVQDARVTQALAVVAADAPGAGTALRLEYRRGPLLHVRQHIKLEADAVYRLSGIAKMIAPAYPEVLGARLAVFTPDRKEVGVVWNYVRPDEWGRQQVLFTNAVSGSAVVYVEMGSRRGARAALVTEVRVERVTDSK